ncbi:DNA ligase 1-like [Pyrus x bretschneideri]|uniref:DNA ligase 1-like n=1 Tax=Pyrus x bretschneideri TaxID=225117 RepID=UPI00202F12D6|nr:DNA ligase 1-like [Pyrus x bretschneideri]
MPLLKKKAREFDPKLVANWGQGERIPFVFVCLVFDLLDKETGRIVITDIVCNMLRTVMYTTPEDLVPMIYLAANRIAPAIEAIEGITNVGFVYPSPLYTAANVLQNHGIEGFQSGSQVRRVQEVSRRIQDFSGQISDRFQDYH